MQSEMTLSHTWWQYKFILYYNIMRSLLMWPYAWYVVLELSLRLQGDAHINVTMMMSICNQITRPKVSDLANSKLLSTGTAKNLTNDLQQAFQQSVRLTTFPRMMLSPHKLVMVPIHEGSTAGLRDPSAYSGSNV